MTLINLTSDTGGFTREDWYQLKSGLQLAGLDVNTANVSGVNIVCDTARISGTCTAAVGSITGNMAVAGTNSANGFAINVGSVAPTSPSSGDIWIDIS